MPDILNKPECIPRILPFYVKERQGKQDRYSNIISLLLAANTLMRTRACAKHTLGFAWCNWLKVGEAKESSVDQGSRVKLSHMGSVDLAFTGISRLLLTTLAELIAEPTRALVRLLVQSATPCAI